MNGCAAAILTVLTSLPNRASDFDEHAPTIAAAIAQVSSSSREAAGLVTLGELESRFAPRIQAGECRKLECDRGLAHGFFQLHADKVGTTVWNELVGLEKTTIDLNVRIAARILGRGRRVCRSEAGAFSYFALGHCGFAGGPRRATIAARFATRLSACNDS